MKMENTLSVSPIEILAPAGSMEALIAAVRSGANAVYFGAGNFNARRNAENFTLENIRQATAYCHRFGVRCYLTLNTLISDDELPQAVELSVQATEAGVDALIVQDLGLCHILHQKLPQIELHASTQMTVLSPAVLPFLKKLGITRVVAARELSLNELKALCNAAKTLEMEVEAFVHGALCMSVSGQCYFSAFLGGRSANRGLCAGTCRLPFQCGNSQNALSLKDLSLISHLQQLQKIGVCSAKIEGRMKRPEYVAAAVHCAVDALKYGAPNSADEQLLRQVFSRNGFTDGYYTEARNNTMFGARSKEDAVLPKALKELHNYYRLEPQSIGITASLTLFAKGSSLTLQCGQHTVEVTGPLPERPISAPLSKESAKKALSKLGGTPYFLNCLNFENPAQLFLRVAQLNAMKTEAVALLDQLRTACNLQLPSYTLPQYQANRRHPKGYFLRLATPKQLPQNLQNILGYSLPAEILSKVKTPLQPKKIWAELPRTCFNESNLFSLLQALKNQGVQNVVIQNLSQLMPAVNLGFQVMGGFGLNLYNHLAAECLQKNGLVAGVLSPELQSTQYLKTGAAPQNFKTYCFSYGYFPFMLLRNCPVKAHSGCQKGNCKITDRKGKEFKLSCTGETVQLYNNRPIYYGDKLNSLPVDGGYLYFTAETPKTVQQILQLHQEKKPFPGEFTRGLFNYGVL